MSEWSDCLRKLQIHHKHEPRDRYNDSNNRLDITVFDVGSGANAELDVALSHPWATDTLSQASKNDGAAAARREIRKTTSTAKSKSLVYFLSVSSPLFLNTLVVGEKRLPTMFRSCLQDQQMMVEIRTLTNSNAIGENASRQLYSVAMQRQLLENYPVLPLQELVM